MKVKNTPRTFFFFTFVFSFLSVTYTCAQDLDAVLAGETSPKTYLLEISGTVNKQNFSGAKAALKISYPVQPASNPYLLYIEGFPFQNSKNVFYWDSNYSDMTASGNEITSEISRHAMKATPPDIYFFYVRPEMLKMQDMPAYQQKQTKHTMARRMLPVRIPAQAGRLKMKIFETSISGTIWLKGYNPSEQAYVEYSARFHGRQTRAIKPGKVKNK